MTESRASQVPLSFQTAEKQEEQAQTLSCCDCAGANWEEICSRLDSMQPKLSKYWRHVS